MPKVKRSRKPPPDGWELIEPTLDELDQKMREGRSVFIRMFLRAKTNGANNCLHCVLSIVFLYVGQKIKMSKTRQLYSVHCVLKKQISDYLICTQRVAFPPCYNRFEKEGQNTSLMTDQIQVNRLKNLSRNSAVLLLDSHLHRITGSFKIYYDITICMSARHNIV